MEKTPILGNDDAENKKVSKDLNHGITREIVVKNNLCKVAGETDPQMENNFAVLRRGYPDRPLSEQAYGGEFREAAQKIIAALADQTLSSLSPEEKEKTVVLMPWRSGLAFEKGYEERGIKKFYHLSSKRDEKTLETVVDYEFGKIDNGDTVIITDPMVATGNTIVDAIERVAHHGVTPDHIIINAVVSAPVGIATVKKAYPAVRIITGALDDSLDEHGYIVPGLGDFGDKYFTELSEAETRSLIDSLHIDAEAGEKLKKRIEKQKVSFE